MTKEEGMPNDEIRNDRSVPFRHSGLVINLSSACRALALAKAGQSPLSFGLTARQLLFGVAREATFAKLLLPSGAMD